MSQGIEVLDNAGARRFEVHLDGETAFAEYRLVQGAIILPHTVVPKILEGGGIGSRLATTALAYAREKDLKVIPTCPFIAGYIQKHPEHHDLVHERYRAQLGLS